jgi:hypothetical protein
VLGIQVPAIPSTEIDGKELGVWFWQYVLVKRLNEGITELIFLGENNN